MVLDAVSASTAASGSQAASDQEQLENDLDQFLTLLVTQLQHQDPLDPLDTNEFTSQLVQFASVEQQIYQNAHLEDLLAAQQNSQVAAMVNYLGTSVEIDGDTAPLENGSLRTSYTLEQNVEETTIVVQDATGSVVYSRTGATDAGRHLFDWDGVGNVGTTLPDGGYTVSVLARAADGSLLSVDQTVFGRVTGAAVENNIPVLYMGDIAAPIDDVITVSETPQSTAAEDDRETGNDGEEETDA